MSELTESSSDSDHGGEYKKKHATPATGLPKSPTSSNPKRLGMNDSALEKARRRSNALYNAMGSAVLSELAHKHSDWGALE